MKTYQFGNTVVTVNSPLLALSKEERAEWFANETAKGNPTLKSVEDAVHEAYESVSDTCRTQS